jgi:hypothetical protein
MNLLNDPLIAALQASVSPVVLISGIGLLLLSMTNRLGRVVDRSRTLARDARHEELSAVERRLLRVQVRILYHRGRLLVAAIGLCTLSLFLVAVLVGYLFLHFTAGITLPGVPYIVFALALLSIITSLALFLIDILVTLKALRHEVGFLLSPRKP